MAIVQLCAVCRAPGASVVTRLCERCEKEGRKPNVLETPHDWRGPEGFGLRGDVSQPVSQKGDETMANDVANRSSTYRYRNAEKRRAYMKDYMARKRAK